MPLDLPPELIAQGLIKPIAKTGSSQPTRTVVNLDTMNILPPDAPMDTTPRMSAKEILNQRKEAPPEIKKMGLPDPFIAPISPPKPREDEPIVLQYKFTGTQAGVPLDTIMLEIDGRAFAVAYNPVTHTHVQTLEVVPMKKQPFLEGAKKELVEKMKKGAK